MSGGVFVRVAFVRVVFVRGGVLSVYLNMHMCNYVFFFL